MKSETTTPTGEFTLRLSATRRGARLARLLAVQQLHDWGVTGSAAEAAEQVVAELANNAALHGRVRGRDFEVRMERGDEHVRIELSDARGERRPSPAGQPDEGGYGLVLVAALSTTWGVKDRSVGKTVWAAVPLVCR
ncbi:ATP-binding protein [Streptomyces narbonensis]|uniref:ATP-binding protein n=1 Tax=Streptomyces narbonensis TaxID=67333 RepID=UPI00167BD20C|nr:ATP-binding protein [Streptomyces narbonensis]GGV97361.1 ATP-binding protein [Streptomyces narbonensis]